MAFRFRYKTALDQIRGVDFSLGNPVDCQMMQDRKLNVDHDNEVLASTEHLARHMAVLGVSGSGKSKFLEQLGRHFIDSQNGFTFIDPHGDTSEALLRYIVQEHGDSYLERVHYLEPTADRSFAFDPFGRLFDDPDKASFEHRRAKLVDDMRGILMRSTAAADAEVMKRLKRYLTTMLTIIATPLPNGGRFSLADIDVFLSRFHDRHHEAVKLVRKQLPRHTRFDLDELASLASGKHSDEISSTINLLRTAINPTTEQIFGLHAPSIDFAEVIAKRGFCIVNLKTESMNRDHTKPIAGFIIRELMNIAQSTPEEKRVPHNLIIDEAGEFLGEDFKDILEECRKYRLSLCVAGQTISSFQLGDSVDIGNELQSHCRTVVCFQQRSVPDVETLGTYLGAPNRILFERFQAMQVDAPELDQILLLKSWSNSHGGSSSVARGRSTSRTEGSGLAIAEGNSLVQTKGITSSHTDGTNETSATGSGYSQNKGEQSTTNRSHGDVVKRLPDATTITQPSTNYGMTDGLTTQSGYNNFSQDSTGITSSDTLGESESEARGITASRATNEFSSVGHGESITITDGTNWSESVTVSEHLRTGSKLIWLPTGEPLYSLPFQDAIYQTMLTTLPQQFALVRSQITGVEQTIMFRVHNLPKIVVDKADVEKFKAKLAKRFDYLFRRESDADTAQEKRLEAIFGDGQLPGTPDRAVKDEDDTPPSDRSDAGRDSNPFFGDD